MRLEQRLGIVNSMELSEKAKEQLKLVLAGKKPNCSFYIWRCDNDFYVPGRPYNLFLLPPDYEKRIVSQLNSLLPPGLPLESGIDLGAEPVYRVEGPCAAQPMLINPRISLLQILFGINLDELKKQTFEFDQDCTEFCPLMKMQKRVPDIYEKYHIKRPRFPQPRSRYKSGLTLQ